MALKQRLGQFCIRFAVVLLAAGLLLALPESDSNDVLRYKNALTVLFAVIATGKLLYDTFFYERYH